jgi:hypothetical protein
MASPTLPVEGRRPVSDLIYFRETRPRRAARGDPRSVQGNSCTSCGSGIGAVRRGGFARIARECSWRGAWLLFQTGAASGVTVRRQCDAPFTLRVRFDTRSVCRSGSSRDGSSRSGATTNARVSSRSRRANGFRSVNDASPPRVSAGGGARLAMSFANSLVGVRRRTDGCSTPTESPFR